MDAHGRLLSTQKARVVLGYRLGLPFGRIYNQRFVIYNKQAVLLKQRQTQVKKTYPCNIS